MIRTTGGRAFGATSTRSRPWLSAAASASSTGMMPSCAPSALDDPDRTDPDLPVDADPLLDRDCSASRMANKKQTRADGSAPATSAPASQCGRRRSLLNPAVPRARTEGWGGWNPLPLPDGQPSKTTCRRAPCQVKSTRFTASRTSWTNFARGMISCFSPAPRRRTATVPACGLALADDGHERDLLRSRRRGSGSRASRSGRRGWRAGRPASSPGRGLPAALTSSVIGRTRTCSGASQTGNAPP